MKPAGLLIALFLCLNTWGAAVPAEPSPLPAPAIPPARFFQVECRMVQLPVKVALPLIPQLSDDVGIVTAWPKVEDLLARGEATLVGHLLSRGAEHQRMVATSVEELRYATGFQPPNVPDNAPGSLPSLEVLKNWPYVGITPTNFETRDLGETLELEASPTRDPRTVSCSLSIHHTRFEKFVKIEAGHLASGERLSVEQPYFTDLSDTCETTLESGHPKLVGVHLRPDADAMIELFVLTLKLAPAP